MKHKKESTENQRRCIARNALLLPLNYAEINVWRNMNMILNFNYDHWDSCYSEPCSIEIENLNVKEGYTLHDIDEVISYLAYTCFANDYVSPYSIREAIYDVTNELGCVYEDVYELEQDIRKYYI